MSIISRDKGSLTVETSIVFFVTFVCIMFIIYISVMLYQQSILNSVAYESAAKGAKHILADKCSKETLQNAILEHINTKLHTNKHQNINVHIKVIPLGYHEKIFVTIQKAYFMPFGAVFNNRYVWLTSVGECVASKTSDDIVHLDTIIKAIGEKYD